MVRFTPSSGILAKYRQHGHLNIGPPRTNDLPPYIYIYIYIYIYTVGPVYEMKVISQTRFSRKPDVCPVSEAKFRKPVLAGLRSNNEMNLFGFRRCYRSKIKNC